MATPTTPPCDSTDSSPRQSASSPGDLTALFPALHLLRASGLAIDPRKMLLGGIALLLLAGGEWLFEFLPFASGGSTTVVVTHQEPSFFDRGLEVAGFRHRSSVDSWLSWDTVAFSLLTPIRTLIEPGRVLFQVGNSWSSLALAWTQLLWALTVWSLIGGALCRMNALQFATRRRIGVWTALKFSRRQLLAYLVAPLSPLSAVLILQGFNWLLGYVVSLVPSSVGVVALAIGWGLVLFCGFLMAMLVLGIAAGWPLMIAAISTEDSDGFDGLSRAFGYLFDRPWHAVLFAISSFPVFAASRILVAILIGLTASLAAYAVERGNDSEIVHDSTRAKIIAHSIEVSPAGHTADDLDAILTGNRRFIWPGSIPQRVFVAWTCIPALLYVGFGPSFFWSATTVSYFLLRKSDDGTPLDSVVDWPEQADPDATDNSTGEADSA